MKYGVSKIGNLLKRKKACSKKIKIAGDHSNYHCGSFAVYSVICDSVKKRGILVNGEEDFDVLVVNGEGSMHSNSASMKKKIKEIELSLNEGKEVHLVNTVWQDNEQHYSDIIKGCSSVIAREELSRKQLAEQGVEATVQYDASYHYDIDEDSDFMDFKGEVVFTDFWSKEFKSFVILNSRWPKRFYRIDMTSVSWSYLVKSLRTASLLVTGRHHAVYAACKAEIPFLAMPGNTHKIEGIFETAGVYPSPICYNFSEVKKLVEKGDLSSCKDSCNELFSVMRQLPQWKIDI